MASTFGKKKPSHAGAGEGKSKTPGYRTWVAYPDEYAQELTPLDIIKEDTDIINEDVRYAFELPPNPMEIVDYLGHYFLPAEKAA